MGEKQCNQCSATIPIPDNYAAPYIKCPECGSHERVPAQSDKPKRLSTGKHSVTRESLQITSDEVLNNDKYFEDTLGIAGLKETYKLVANYMLEKSIEKRRILKSKTIQQLMRKHKVAAGLVSQAMDYAEKAPKTQEIIVQKIHKKQTMLNIGIAFIIAITIGFILTLL